MECKFHILECNCDNCKKYLKEQLDCKCKFCIFKNNNKVTSNCKLFNFLKTEIPNLEILENLVSDNWVKYNLKIDYIPKDKYKNDLIVNVIKYFLKLIETSFKHDSKIIKVYLSAILFEVVFSTKRFIIKNNKFRITFLNKLKELVDDINSDNYVKDKLLSLFGEENILVGFHNNCKLFFDTEETIIIKLPDSTCIRCKINEFSTCKEIIINIIRDYNIQCSRRLLIGYKNKCISEDSLLNEVIVDKNVPLYLV